MSTRFPPLTRKFGNAVFVGTNPHDTGALAAQCYPTNGTADELAQSFAFAQLFATAPKLLGLVRDVAAQPFHTLPDEGPCSCTRCAQIREAQALFAEATRR